MINEIMQFNSEFVKRKEYESFLAGKYPNKKTAIVSCMDTRLTELLPAALGLKNGDALIIKNAGGVISHPFGSVMRSLLIAIYELGVQEILVIGHTDCGARHTDSDHMMDIMKGHGVPQTNIDLMNYCGINFESWLSGFHDLDRSVTESVDLIRKHPLIPEGVIVYGLVIDSETGELRMVASPEPGQ